MYFRIKKITRIRQGRPQTPTKVPTIIDESLREKEEIGPNDGKIEEVTPKKQNQVTYNTCEYAYQ